MRGDFAAPERRIRKPVKGLRQRLRVALRASGVTAKFRTDHGRRFMGYGKDFLIVITKAYFKLPFESFDGKPVVLMVRT
jgi:hypothetical protein